MVSVYNLSTGENVGEYTCTPREAVISAYAQFEKKDFNTWDYENQYGSLVTEGELTIACGDYCTMNEGVTDNDLLNALDDSYLEDMMDRAMSECDQEKGELEEYKYRLLNEGE